ncbi:hypothetical protein BsIDN1_05850 [Bacillus safensis]|uniref:Uncharacterized protein n=1 Tax=Bacillus safensis TaxID=561879 RepID=A0A5S9M023_BACIA|nr:hypothetical protein BsIDN1_05850 [Bacillus safensis]
MKELFEERREIYSLHNSRVETDHLEAEEVANYIVDTLKLGWDLYSKKKVYRLG